MKERAVTRASGETIKLDICGGSYPMGKGYINVDARPLPEVDVVADLPIGLPFRSDSVDEIVSCGTLEHFSPRELPAVLGEMFRILKNDGKLTIGVPDLQAIMNRYLLNEIDVETVNQYLYGSQKNPFDLHKIGFDFATLAHYLQEAGFAKCRKTAYSLPFHLPQFMMQVECYKTVNREGLTMKDDQASSDEVLDWEAAEIDFTGERLVPGDAALNDLYVKHMARYLFARNYIAGKTVLDAGCGCGYGTHALAVGGAHRVTGIDASQAAIAYCRKYYATPDTVFLPADCLNMPFADRSFDVVVSFEVIEHLEDYQGYLAQCARVLRDDGLLIISTPNRKIWQERKNPYHFREFLLEEFRQLLSGYFQVIDILGQDITPEYMVNRSNENKMFTFQSQLINYYDESFRYTERQLDSLRETTQERVDQIMRSHDEIVRRYDIVLREQEEMSKKMTHCLGLLVERDEQLQKETARLIFDCLIPERIRRLVPGRLRTWLSERVERKIAAEHDKYRGRRQAFHTSLTTVLPQFFRVQEELSADQKLASTVSWQAKRICFPKNPDRKKLVRPVIDPVPMSLASVSIQKEFVDDAMYFIALCRKKR